MTRKAIVPDLWQRLLPREDVKVGQHFRFAMFTFLNALFSSCKEVVKLMS